MHDNEYDGTVSSSKKRHSKSVQLTLENKNYIVCILVKVILKQRYEPSNYDNNILSE